MFVCLHNETEIAHAREITEEELVTEWPLYELEAMNRGGAWRPYKGETEFKFPEPVEEPADEV
jgi:uncharacterized protein YdeI (YjbR/CyaY-like superfamily)